MQSSDSSSSDSETVLPETRGHRKETNRVSDVSARASLSLLSPDDYADLGIRSTISETAFRSNWYVAAEGLSSSTVLRTPARTLKTWMVLYSISSIVYFFRAVIMWFHGQHHDFVAPTGFGLMSLVIGVILPYRSWTVCRSGPMNVMLVHRDHYPEFKGSQFHPLTSIARVLAPVSALLGLVGPAHVILLLWYPYHRQAELIYHIAVDDLKLGLFITMSLGYSGMLVFGSGAVYELALDASTCAIKGFAKDLETAGKNDAKDLETADETDSGSSDTDIRGWHDFGKQHRYLDKALDDLWGVDAAGGIWLLRIAVLLIASVAIASWGVGHGDKTTRYILQADGLLLAVSAMVILMNLAAITSMCRNKRAGSRSIYAITMWIGGGRGYEHSSREQQLEYQDFAAYVRDSDIGVQILGVAITYELVFDLGAKMLLYIPVALGVLAEFWHADERRKANAD